MKKKCPEHNQDVYTICLYPDCENNRFPCSSCMQKHKKHSATHIIKLDKSSFKILEQNQQLKMQMQQQLVKTLLNVKKQKLATTLALKKQLEIWENNFAQKTQLLKIQQMLFQSQTAQQAYKTVIENKDQNKIKIILFQMNSLIEGRDFKPTYKNQIEDLAKGCYQMLQQLNTQVIPALSSINRSDQYIFTEKIEKLEPDTNCQLITQIKSKYKCKIKQKINSSLIDDSDHQFRNIYGIILQSNDFKQIPEEISKLTMIQELFLDMNNIQQISCLSSLINLKILYLNNNKIKIISGMDQLKNLTKLNLSQNVITTIQGLSNLHKLNELNLRSNKIKLIQNLENLKALKSLNLGKNQIVTIQGLTKLKNLQKLHLHKNRITSIDLTALEDFKNRINLQKLYIYENPCSLHLLENTIIQQISTKTKIFILDNIQPMNHKTPTRHHSLVKLRKSFEADS